MNERRFFIRRIFNYLVCLNRVLQYGGYKDLLLYRNHLLMSAADVFSSWWQELMDVENESPGKAELLFSHLTPPCPSLLPRLSNRGHSSQPVHRPWGPPAHLSQGCVRWLSGHRHRWVVSLGRHCGCDVNQWTTKKRTKPGGGVKDSTLWFEVGLVLPLGPAVFVDVCFFFVCYRSSWLQRGRSFCGKSSESMLDYSSGNSWKWNTDSDQLRSGKHDIFIKQMTFFA